MNQMVDKMGHPEGIDPDWKFDPDVSRRKLVKFIVVNEMPFFLVESSSFREFTKSLNPWFENVSRTTIKNDCEAAFQMHGDRMKRYFENLDSRVCDMWTSNQKLGYLCMTCHFISDDWKLHKSVCLLRKWKFSKYSNGGWNWLNLFTVPSSHLDLLP
uniref:Uncharacterized protein n=1 Tax=Avena sativa TaxID=4498 RepID=A0ACD5UWJ3_AVESA